MTTRLLTGTFAFTFEGSCVFKDAGGKFLTLSEVGVGTMIITKGGKIVGRQDAIATPVGADPLPHGYPLFCRYQLKGEYTANRDGVTGIAEIKFKPSRDCPGCSSLSASFSIVRAGDKNFWFISKHASISTTNAKGKAIPVTVDEVCRGEAVMIEALTKDDLKLPAGRGTLFHRTAANPAHRTT